MPKKEEVKVPKKVKEQMTEEIIEEITSTVKKDITESVVSDIRSSFDKEYKDGIKEEIKDCLIDDIKKDIAKEQKKLTRNKSFKIFRLYIYLIVLVVALGYLLFRLYETDNLTVIHDSYTRRTTTSITNSDITTTTTEKVKDGEYYIKNYSYLMDNVKISNLDLVKNGVVVDEMDMRDKLTMAYHNLNASLIEVDGIIHSLKEEDLMNSYKKIYGSDDYSQTNFIANGLNYAYSNVTQAFMAIGEEVTDDFVQNILVNGYEDENGNITLEARAYVVKNNAVYNPNNMNYRITNVSDDMDLSRVQNRLLAVEYKFMKNDNGYNLMSIVRK